MPRSPKRPAAQVRTASPWGDVFLAWGLALLVGGMGALVLWASLTAPDVKTLNSRPLSASFQLVRALPFHVQSKLGAAAGGLFLLGGLWFFLLGCLAAVRRK